MLTIKYVELFRVVFSHDFYTTGITNDLVVEPAAESLKILKGLGWVYRSLQGGFAVFGEVKGVDASNRPLLKKPMTEDVKLLFVLKTTNPAFVNFTALPLSPGKNNVYYFSNLHRNITGGKKLLVGGGTAATQAGGADLVKLAGNTYSYHHTSNQNKQTLSLKNLHTPEELQQTLDNNNDTFDFQFRLNGLPKGMYAAKRGATTVDTFYVGHELAGERIFGLLEIFTGGAIHTDYRFIINAGTAVRPAAYTIAFGKRTTYWRYLIINKFGNNLTNPGVVRQNGTVLRFDKVNGPAFPANYQVFVSQNPIPFEEKKLLNINLRRNFQAANANSGTVFIEHLPNPTPGLLKPDPNDANKLYADVQVFV